MAGSGFCDFWRAGFDFSGGNEPLLYFACLGLYVDYIYCLLFGALISPTDPIAVLGILKKAGIPKKLETKIVGESLFNDGVGVVVFLTIFNIASMGEKTPPCVEVLKLFGQEVIGGIALGLLLGYVTYNLMRTIDDYDIEVIITLAAVWGETPWPRNFMFLRPLLWWPPA